MRVEMPKYWRTTLCFSYEEEEVEVTVDFSFSTDPEEEYLDVNIVKNETKFTNDELLVYIVNNEDLVNRLENESYCKFIEWEQGLDDARAERFDD